MSYLFFIVAQKYIIGITEGLLDAIINGYVKGDVYEKSIADEK